jgi:hypothetical protein
VGYVDVKRRDVIVETADFSQLNNLPTGFIEQNYFEELIVAQLVKKPGPLWNPTFYYRFHKNPAMNLILKLLNPVKTLTLPYTPDYP